jgi:hypothetical protein
MTEPASKPDQEPKESSGKPTVPGALPYMWMDVAASSFQLGMAILTMPLQIAAKLRKTEDK